MKQIKPNTPLNDVLNYEMQKQTYAGYNLWSNNFTNMQRTQINHQIYSNNHKVQIQSLTSINLTK